MHKEFFFSIQTHKSIKVIKNSADKWLSFLFQPFITKRVFSPSSQVNLITWPVFATYVQLFPPISRLVNDQINY